MSRQGTVNIILCVSIFVYTVVSLFIVIERNNEIKIKDDIINDLSIRLETIDPQLKFNIETVGLCINDIPIIDSAGKKQMLSEYISGRSKLLMCRYSNRYCQQCVDYAISVLRNNTNQTDLGNIVFINDSVNSRMLKFERNNYNINNYSYCSCNDLGIPAEKVMFPYYMVLDSALRIRNVYFPNKEAKKLGVDAENVKLILQSLAN